MLMNYIRLMRPADWTKNVFILPAILFTASSLIASNQLDELYTKIMPTVWAIVAFSLLSSGFYAINDSLDYLSDRTHPVKCRRPIASGAISPLGGRIFGLVLAAIGIIIGFCINPDVGYALLTYFALQTCYNLGLKRIVVVDAVALAIGFSIRAAVGAFAIGVPVSMWLLGLVFFATLYLAFIKRKCDLESARAVDSSWSPSAGYGDPLELNWLLGLSGVTIILSWILYALSPHAQQLFGVKASGFAMLTPFVIIVVHRFYHRAQHGRSDSPLSSFIDDKVMAAGMLFFASGLGMFLFVPSVSDWLSRLIFAGAPS